MAFEWRGITLTLKNCCAAAAAGRNGREFGVGERRLRAVIRRRRRIAQSGCGSVGDRVRLGAGAGAVVGAAADSVYLVEGFLG